MTPLRLKNSLESVFNDQEYHKISTDVLLIIQWFIKKNHKYSFIVFANNFHMAAFAIY